MHKRIGEQVTTGEPLVTLHVADLGVDAARDRVLEAFRIGEERVAPHPLFGERIAGTSA